MGRINIRGDGPGHGLKKLIFAFILNVFLVAIVAGYLVDLLVY
jgi:hypothetical protein